MRKIFFATFLSVGISFVGSTQTLFTYGPDSVSVTDFLKAYNKNNTSAEKNKDDLQTYLDLYIASRLKIKEAKVRGYDTLPQLVSDLQGLREQIIPSYLVDEEATKWLVDEAIIRSQKDIRLAHVFIATTNSTDTSAGFKKATEAYSKIKKGESFNSVAKQYSEDPSAKINGGDVGFITVFNLPYALENLIYTTPVGKIAPIYSSKSGYHIFKNVAERKALGRMKAAQILIAFPPDANESAKVEAKRLADSLYSRLQKGDDFEKLATAFSNDVISAASDGLMQEFGVGEYEAVFENAVFGLSNDGSISKPFKTEHGWHIVKRTAHLPAVTNTIDEKTVSEFRERVEQSDRINTTKAALVQKIVKEANLKQSDFVRAELWTYTDSAVLHQKVVAPAIFNNNYLLQLGDKKITIDEWYAFVETNRYRTDGSNGSGVKTYEELWDEFISFVAMEYYKENLERFNPSLNAQMEEFKDGNLFFEIMQQQIWGPSQTDTVALEKFYSQHKNKYVWNKSADAVIFYAADMATAGLLQTQLLKTPNKWKELANELNEKVAVDTNRFELTAIPGALKTPLKEGMITKPLLNETDKTAFFAYIIKMYNEPSPRSFEDAKGLVVNDYQAELEKKWIGELKKKYPVVVNEKAWLKLVRNP